MGWLLNFGAPIFGFVTSHMGLLSLIGGPAGLVAHFFLSKSLKWIALGIAVVAVLGYIGVLKYENQTKLTTIATLEGTLATRTQYETELLGRIQESQERITDLTAAQVATQAAASAAEAALAKFQNTQTIASTHATEEVDHAATNDSDTVRSIHAATIRSLHEFHDTSATAPATP